ncbi:MAG: hypothetical protein ACTHJ0_11485 [Flavipsychrobacter sp.]
MRKNYPVYKLVAVALVAVAFQSCRKYNDINTDTVIVAPYSLYFSDSAGSLINTNDGNVFKPSVFPSDGYPSRAICVAGENLMWVKGNAHISTNNGVNFNPTYTYVNPLAFNQSLILYAKDEDRVYMASAEQRGIEYSDQKGAIKSWQSDTAFNKAIAAGSFLATSFAQLKDNTVIVYDYITNRIFTKGNKTAAWVESKPLPAPAKFLPSGHKFSLGHYNNTLVAIDSMGKGGAWYSNDKGASWNQYTGLPTTRPLLCVASPFDGVLLVGTDSLGIYALQGSSTSFAYSGSGLGINSSVRGIAFKENVYENGVAKQYVYIATSQGIYRSQDLGQNWVQVIAGNYYSIW